MEEKAGLMDQIKYLKEKQTAIQQLIRQEGEIDRKRRDIAVDLDVYLFEFDSRYSTDYLLNLVQQRIAYCRDKLLAWRGE